MTVALAIRILHLVWIFNAKKLFHSFLLFSSNLTKCHWCSSLRNKYSSLAWWPRYCDWIRITATLCFFSCSNLFFFSNFFFLMFKIYGNRIISTFVMIPLLMAVVMMVFGAVRATTHTTAAAAAILIQTQHISDPHQSEVLHPQLSSIG